MKIDIKQKLSDNNMSRYELAKRIGVTYPTITSIFNGDTSSVKLDTLESICRELDCSLDEILVFDDKSMRDQQVKRILAYKKYFDTGDTE